SDEQHRATDSDPVHPAPDPRQDCRAEERADEIGGGDLGARDPEILDHRSDEDRDPSRLPGRGRTHHQRGDDRHPPATRETEDGPTRTTSSPAPEHRTSPYVT